MSKVSNTNSAFCLVQEHLGTVITEIFEGLGMWVSAEPGDGCDTENLVSSSIVFAGDHVEGAISLVTSSATVDSWRAELGGVDESVDVCDMLGETANVMLGRLKGRLLRSGLPVSLSVPTSARGQPTIAPPAPTACWLVADGQRRLLIVRLRAEFDADFELGVSAEAASPGELILF